MRLNHLTYYALTLVPVVLAIVLGTQVENFPTLLACIYGVIVASIAIHMILTSGCNLVLSRSDEADNDTVWNFILVPAVTLVCTVLTLFFYRHGGLFPTIFVAGVSLVVVIILTWFGMLGLTHKAVNRTTHFQRRSHEAPY